jgi:multicomponent Na+:H+ antiporter subunit E
MKVPRWLVASLLFGALWVFVRGSSIGFEPLLADFVAGTLAGLPVAYVFRRLYEEEVEVVSPLATMVPVIGYAVHFSREIVVANLDVAYRVLSPEMPLEPQVIFVPLRVETAVGVTTIANSITITPGTITLDHDPEENGLYVHVIDGRNPDAVAAPIRQWEDYALQIFDEPKSPDDPPRDIRVHPPDYPPEPITLIEEFGGGELPGDQPTFGERSEPDSEEGDNGE